MSQFQFASQVTNIVLSKENKPKIMRSAGPSAIVAAVIYSILVSATTFGELHENKCSLNPSSWCNNLSNAQNCQATQDCIRNVWEKRSVPLDKSPVCQICKDMIGQARNKLPNNNAEAELQQLFNEPCKQIPMESIQMECRILTKHSLTELIEVLSSNMNNEQICTVVGLCNSVTINAMLMESYHGALDGTLDDKDFEVEMPEKSRAIRSVAQPDQLSCSTCNILTLALREKFESTKRDDMLEGLLHFCYSLQSYSEVCANIVVSNFDDFFELAREQLQSNDLCRVVNICDKAMSLEEEVEATTNDRQFYCDLCKQVVPHIRKSIAKLPEAKFKEMLLGYCKHMRGYQAQCLKDVDQYSHVVYSLLKSQLKPEAVCQLLGVCQRHKAEEDEQEQKSDDDELTNELITVDEPKLPQCFVCKSAFRIAKKLLRSHTSNDKLMNAMNRCCNILGKLADKCHQLVNSHGDKLARFAKNPRVLCTLLGMCFPIGQDAEQEEFVVELYADNEEEQFLSTELAYKQSGRCKLCKKTIKYLINLNKYVKDIKVSLEHVCRAFKDRPSRMECEQMTKQHASLIIDLVQKNLTSHEICRTLNICLLFEQDEEDLDENNDENPMEIEEFLSETDLEVEGSPKCKLCHSAMNALQHILRNRSDRGSVQKAMQKCCDKMGPLKGKCQKMVQKHGDKIVDLMTNKTGAQMICKLIGVCKMSVAEEQLESEDELAVQQNAVVEFADELVDYVEGTPECSICRTAMRALQDIVRNRADRGSIQRGMQRCCERMGALKDRCQSMIQSHGNEIVDLMTQKVPPSKICKMIGMCKSSVEDEDFDFDKLEISEDSENQQNELQDWETVQPEKGPVCILCETFVSKFQLLVKTKAKREQIMQNLLLTCDVMPSPIREPCRNAALLYGTIIIDLLSTSTPHEICHFVNFCFSQQEYDEFVRFLNLTMKEDKLDELQLADPERGPFCIICELVVRRFERLLDTKAKRDHILKTILQVSNYFPHLFRDPLKSIVNGYGAAVLDLISKVKPKEVCHFMPQCLSNE